MSTNYNNWYLQNSDGSQSSGLSANGYVGITDSILGGVSSVMDWITAGYGWKATEQQIKNMKQQYKINEEYFNDYKKERDRVNKIRSNTQKQFTNASQITSSY